MIAAPAGPYWHGGGRIIVFLLASSSLGCLLADFYGVCSMRVFTLMVFLPAAAALIGLTVYDAIRGDGRLGWSVLIGLGAGVMAAVAYDVFRLPFVFAREW